MPHSCGPRAAKTRYYSLPSLKTIYLLSFILYLLQNVSSGVADCTSPRVNENDLPEYFWSHFVHDVEVFSKTIGRSVQDAVVVCHEMLKRIVIGGEKAAGDLLILTILFYLK